MRLVQRDVVSRRRQKNRSFTYQGFQFKLGRLTVKQENRPNIPGGLRVLVPIELFNEEFRRSLQRFGVQMNLTIGSVVPLFGDGFVSLPGLENRLVSGFFTKCPIRRRLAYVDRSVQLRA